MNGPLVSLDIEQEIARITLNRPAKRNALSRQLIAELTQAVAAVGADDSARLLVLSAEGPVFCAGMDLGEMQERAGHPHAVQLWQEDTQVYRDLLVELFSLSVPTLAVVQGPALAGGVGLVLACDIVLAADTASFSLPEPKRGITAAVVAPLLIYRAGPGPATYLLLSGNTIPAAEAQRLHLCHEIAGSGRLAEREQELAESILGGAPSALAATKRHIIASAGSSLIDQIDAGMKVSAEARETDDAREGLAAFLEKREPRWNVRLEN